MGRRSRFQPHSRATKRAVPLAAHFGEWDTTSPCSLLEERGPVLVNEAQKAEMRVLGIASVRWLAPSSMGSWCPLAEKRGEWDSLDRHGARS